MTLALSQADHDRLAGRQGTGVALAMRIVVRTAEAMGAATLVDIVSAHVDGCLFHGQAGMDLVRALLAGGATTVVPTTLNVGSVDLLHPELNRGDPNRRQAGKELMDLYSELGCSPTYTCAPYQLAQRPALGDQIAWAESNAIVFANSVLGARTERYGDFLDICAAVTGRAPLAGLHLAENRRASWIADVTPLGRLLETDAAYPLVGHALGALDLPGVPAIVGLPADVSEDRLKALGASGAASGALAMFHAVGVTPEAPSSEDLTASDLEVQVIDRSMLEAAAGALTTGGVTRVDAIALGTPHYSLDQLGFLASLLDGVSPQLRIYVNTGRDTLAATDPGVIAALDRAGVTIVTDTCTYLTPIMDPAVKAVMTDSAKWAYYAPSNLGVEVAFGTVEDCVRTAVQGRLSISW